MNSINFTKSTTRMMFKNQHFKGQIFNTDQLVLKRKCFQKTIGLFFFFLFAQLLFINQVNAQCPAITTVTAATDGCSGSQITLTATVDMGVENVDYMLQWYEDGVAIPGCKSPGPDNLPGTADDISVLSHQYTLPVGGSCAVTDHQYSVQLNSSIKLFN